MYNGQPRVLTEENRKWVVDVIRAEVSNTDDPALWKEATAKVRTLAARLLAVTSLDSFDAYNEYKKNKGA